MAADPRFARNHDRVAHEAEIDAAITAWTSQHPFDEVLSALEQAEVPAGAILNVADQVNHPHFQARGLFERVPLPTDPDDTVLLPRVAPFLSETPGGTDWAGPPLGAHNREVYGGLLGLSDEAIDELKAKGAI